MSASRLSASMSTSRTHLCADYEYGHAKIDLERPFRQRLSVLLSGRCSQRACRCHTTKRRHSINVLDYSRLDIVSDVVLDCVTQIDISIVCLRQGNGQSSPLSLPSCTIQAFPFCFSISCTHACTSARRDCNSSTNCEGFSQSRAMRTTESSSVSAVSANGRSDEGEGFVGDVEIGEGTV